MSNRMSLRTVVDRIVAWVRQVEDAGPDPTFRQRRCPNPDHVGTEVIATTHGTVLRHWCSECGADLITPRGRIVYVPVEAKPAPIVHADDCGAPACGDWSEGGEVGEGWQVTCPRCPDGHTNGHTSEIGSPYEDEG